MSAALSEADDLVGLSGLQHVVFCERQAALIHVERVWREDGATAEGRVLHERADLPGAEQRRGVRVERSVALSSRRLGLLGRADVVEYHADPEAPGVVCFGRVLVSPELMAALAGAGVHLSFLTPTGRFLARVEGVPGGNVLLRRQQYRAADDPARTAAIARAMVLGKVANARQFLLHARRDAADEARDALAAAAERLALLLRSAASAEGLDALRGAEGAAAREYFGVFNELLKRNPDTFRFESRSRRPPLDPINALLSFGYVLLMQDCAGAAAGVGLDPAVGYLHEERPGRLCLALDLMEELRAPVVDRLVLALVNRGQVGPDDFVKESSGACRMTDDARKRFLVAYQEAKRGEIRHPYLEQDTTWAQVPHLQALLLARAIRGELEVYPPFAIR